MMVAGDSDSTAGRVSHIVPELPAGADAGGGGSGDGAGRAGAEVRRDSGSGAARGAVSRVGWVRAGVARATGGVLVAAGVVIAGVPGVITPSDSVTTPGVVGVVDVGEAAGASAVAAAGCP
jgi:hypothetical protein